MKQSYPPEAKKEKSVQKYPAFGEKLFSIVTDNLPDGGVKDKKSVVAFFRKEDRLYFDASCTYAWLKGDLLGSKPLIPENFKRILLFYMGKNGLRTLDEIHGWIALGPKRYEAVLSSEEVQKALHSKKIMKQTLNHGTELSERQRLWSRVVHLVCAASDYGQFHRGRVSSIETNLIIIQGPPGVGKTTLLNRLGTDPLVKARFDEVFQASCHSKMSPQTFLDFCLRKLLPGEDWLPGQKMVLKADLQKAIQGKRILFLIDKLSSPEEINRLKPLCELGCVLVVTTRCLGVARQADYSNVIELTSYSISDVLEYYTKNYAAKPSPVNQEKLIQLAEMVCFNPLGLDIALRRVAEEGWESVMEKVRLAPSIWKEDVFEDLHKPFWLAYSSLSAEDQDKFRRLGALPTLASYDEERLGLVWGVSKIKANEILVRMEKEAGLAQRSLQNTGCWHFHPQVVNYARCLLKESPLRTRFRSRFYPMRVAYHEKRPSQFHHVYRRGVKWKVVKKYWQMIRAEGKRRSLPFVLAELRRFVNPSYSTDWSIFTQLTENCTLEEYIWGYRNYLAGGLDIWVFFSYLFLIGVIGGLQRLAIHCELLDEDSVVLGVINLFLISCAIVWAFHLVLRDLRRRYDWGQLWQTVTVNHIEDMESEVSEKASPGSIR